MLLRSDLPIYAVSSRTPRKTADDDVLAWIAAGPEARASNKDSPDFFNSMRDVFETTSAFCCQHASRFASDVAELG